MYLTKDENDVEKSNAIWKTGCGHTTHKIQTFAQYLLHLLTLVREINYHYDKHQYSFGCGAVSRHIEHEICIRRFFFLRGIYGAA